MQQFSQTAPHQYHNVVTPLVKMTQLSASELLYFVSQNLMLFRNKKFFIKMLIFREYDLLQQEKTGYFLLRAVHK